MKRFANRLASRSRDTRELLEAAAFGIRHNLEVMAADGEVPLRRVVAAGGGAASRLWPQIVSDVTGLTQEIPAGVTGAAYGDAHLAAHAAGLIGSDGADGWGRTHGRIIPKAGNARLSSDRHGAYLALYESTRELVHGLASSSARTGATVESHKERRRE